LSPANSAFSGLSFVERESEATQQTEDEAFRLVLFLNSTRQELPPLSLITHESAGPKRLLAVRASIIMLVNAAFVAKMRTD
jgi:hypothetical protein